MGENPITISFDKVTPKIIPRLQEPIPYSWIETSDIVKGYAKESWRPAQSIIDLIQNHLDAQEAVWEKHFLQAVGIDPDAKPDIPEEVFEEERTQILALAHQWRRFKNTPQGKAAFDELKSLRGDAMPDESTLVQQLTHVSPVPDFHLKVRRKGTEDVTNVAYSEITKPEWKNAEIIGFYIYDTGSGFDKSFLGGTGDSTKTDNPFRRGGLGEGLKISTLRMLESGSDIMMVSGHRREQWVGKPQIGDGQDPTNAKLTFKGYATRGFQHYTNSFTVVDFSDSPQLETFQQILDPRIGEGLGKYVLQFAPENSASGQKGGIDTLHRNIPEGRIYILDLLVKDGADTMFSYNIYDKRAITGRDRSEVNEDVLREAVTRAIENLSDPDKIQKIVHQLYHGSPDGKRFLETQVLSGKITLSSQQKEIWKNIIRQETYFLPTHNVLTAGQVTSQDTRLAQEQGFTIIGLPMEAGSALEFIRNLYKDDYPDAPITLSRIKRPERQRQELKPEITRQLLETKKLFKDWLLKQFGQDEHIAMIVAHGLKRLDALQIKQVDTLFSSDSTYDPYSNEMHFKFPDEVTHLSRAEQIIFLCNLTRVVTTGEKDQGKYFFDIQTQAIINAALATALLARDPELSTLTLPNLGEKLDPPHPKETYSTQERAQDELLIATQRAIQKMQQAGSSDKKLLENQQILHSLLDSITQLSKPLQMEEKLEELLESLGNHYYYLDGKVVQIDPKTHDFVPAKLQKKTTQKTQQSPQHVELENGTTLNAFKQIIQFRDTEVLNSSEETINYSILQANQPEYELQQGEKYFIPFAIPDNTSLTLLFTDSSGQTHPYTVRRQGGSLQVINPQKNNIRGLGDEVSLDNSQSLNYYYGFGGDGQLKVFGNVLYIDCARDTYSLAIQPPEASASLVEPTPEGKTELKTEIALTYGEMVWDNPVRAILDAIQNGKDAQKGKMPEILCTVVDPRTYEVQVLPHTQLATLSEDKVIIGMDIVDSGDGFVPKYLLELGKTSKNEDDIGHFGEGLKMLLLSGLRHNIHMELASRDWKATPGRWSKQKFDTELNRDRTFEYLKYDVEKVTSRTGSVLSFSALSKGPKIQPGQKAKITDVQMQQEIQKLVHLRAAGRSKTWFSWTKVVDPREKDALGKGGLDRYMVTDAERKITNQFVTVLLDRQNQIFEHGLLITDLSKNETQPEHNGFVEMLGAKPQVVAAFTTNKDEEVLDFSKQNFFDDIKLEREHQDPLSLPTIFGYDIDGRIITTRERNAYNKDTLNSYLETMLLKTTDMTYMIELLKHARTTTDYREFYILDRVRELLSEGQKAAWRQAYYEVFGEHAILSLKVIDDNRQKQQFRSFQKFSPYGADKQNEQDADLAYAVKKENDLEEVLVRLPLTLTRFFEDVVHTSLDHEKEQRAMPDFQMPTEQKQEAFSFFQRIVETTIGILEDPRNASYVHTLVPATTLQKKITQLRAISIDKFHIKPQEYASYATFIPHGDNDFEFAFNIATLQNRREALTSVAHELAHLFSGYGDYVLPFQTWLMTMAMGDPQCQQRLVS